MYRRCYNQEGTMILLKVCYSDKLCVKLHAATIMHIQTLELSAKFGISAKNRIMKIRVTSYILYTYDIIKILSRMELLDLNDRSLLIILN